ncbi:unnamed protein product [Lepeophtheirus salmonis]|uniref:(salmon louse) hypothetical protein n=1 Tax=Lepeophtheirus salmonis TaxID=72036 RepID=A0A7R8CUN2_LEPSM|nr:unnamed protein product [Lepeophtheirus salmonis]CAF2938084.1 unnamed protein product [Lepeophtheirus salmonis]
MRLRRYETLWIPLIRQHDLKNELLKPPLDIHWMWHLHFHNPYAYKEDLKINCDIPDHGYCRGNMYGTQEVWKREYPLEPYESPSDHEEIKSFIKDFVSSFSYDLIEASKRQSGFYYQVSLPHFRNNQFQRKCIERYQKFLKLKSMYPREFMVPYFDIDFAWHAHMSKPILYEHETSKVLGGEMLNHNDSMEKRVLEDSHKRTTQLWKDLFSEDYEISGVVHRGECPRGKLMDIPNEIKTVEDDNIFSISNYSTLLLEIDIRRKYKRKVNILPGSYYDCIIPENIENLWGPIPLKDLPSDEDNNCKAVVHTIVDKKDDSRVLTVHLVHSLNLGMSCVQLFYGENRISVAHLIGPETLSISHITEFKRFKNSPLGHWTGVSKPTMTKGEGFKPGSPGYFSCSFMSMRHRKDINFKLPNEFSEVFDHEEFSIHIPNKLSVNLVSGEIVYHSGLGDEVIQYTTLSFAISVLYLLVLPTPKDLNSRKPNLNDKFQPLYFKSLYPLFFVYSGIKSIGQMPANSTIYHLRNESKDKSRLALFSSHIPNLYDMNSK